MELKTLHGDSEGASCGVSVFIISLVMSIMQTQIHSAFQAERCVIIASSPGHCYGPTSFEMQINI